MESPVKSNWYAAEGCTAGNFDEWVLIMNPGEMDAQVALTCMLEDGTTKEATVMVPATSRYSVDVGSLVPDAAVSVQATAADSKGIIVERSMYWQSGLGGHNSTAVADPALTWYLAEGCTAGDFEEWVLLMNPNDVTADVLVTFMKNTGEIVNKQINVGGHSRYTIHVDELIPASEVSVKIRSLNEVTIIAERAMYWGSGSVEQVGGHCNRGVMAPANTWYLAEGCTAGSFSTWIAIMNPWPYAAKVKVTFMQENGTNKEKQLTIPATSRQTINVNEEVPEAAVSTKVESTNGISVVVERTMYWDAGGISWAGGHCNSGVTAPATTWYLAEGCTSGGYELWILLMNPRNTRAETRVTFMKDDGTTIENNVVIGPTSRYSINVNEIVPDASVSTKVEATGGVDIIAERAMYWNADSAVLNAATGRSFQTGSNGQVNWIGGHCSSGGN